MTTTPTEPDSQGAHFVGGTPFFASRHDQRLFYALYVPKTHTPEAAPLPLVVVQHGTARSAELYRDQWKEFAIEHNCVIIYGPLNVPAMLPVHASEMFARNLINFLPLIVRDGAINPDWNDEIVAGSVMTHAGEIRNAQTREFVEANT